MTGTPSILENSFDTGCGVHAIVLKLLGPTLDDVRRLCSDGKFNDKMVLAVAIQMVGTFPSLYLVIGVCCSCQSRSLIATRIFTLEE
jgi:casein kinase I family protein HRR25